MFLILELGLGLTARGLGLKLRTYGLGFRLTGLDYITEFLVFD